MILLSWFGGAYESQFPILHAGICIYSKTSVVNTSRWILVAACISILTTLKITISSTFASGLGRISVRVSGNTMDSSKTRNLRKKLSKEE